MRLAAFITVICGLVPSSESRGFTNLPGCECTGDNRLLGKDNIDFHGQDYGKWCAGWEDGACDATATLGPAHTCEGSGATSCEMHWPTYDFTKDQSWCCDSWCYVSNVTCTPEKQKEYGLSIGASWTKTGLWYSYGACADPFSKPAYSSLSNSLASLDKDFSFAQYTPDTCPFRRSSAKPIAAPAMPPTDAPAEWELIEKDCALPGGEPCGGPTVEYPEPNCGLPGGEPCSVGDTRLKIPRA